MDSYHIKVVKTEDLSTLRDIAIKTFRQAFELENTKQNFEKYLDASFNMAILESQLANPNSRFYFLQKGEEVIGYLKINVEDAQTERKLKNALEVERIYLLTTYRGQGVGNILMDKAVKIAQELNKDVVWLGVWEDNPSSIKFYQKYGFRIFDKHHFMMADEAQEDFLMKLILADHSIKNKNE